MMTQFKTYLINKNLSQNTIFAYLFALKQFLDHYDDVSRQNLQAYKLYLIENNSPKTVNLRLRAINCYLQSIKKPKLQLSFVKVQKIFLQNVISKADYEYFKACLIKDGHKKWYFVVRFLATTGVRVSELVKFRAEHVVLGYFDIYSKGTKMRRIYIPKSLQVSAKKWLNESDIESGFIFLNRFSKPITPRGIASELKKFARIYGLDQSVIYPHSFRHLFAKNFLASCNDIAFLADLMGHTSIQTTRIYLRRTAAEQRDLIDRVIDW